jgi:hypothetical protein
MMVYFCQLWFCARDGVRGMAKSTTAELVHLPLVGYTITGATGTCTEPEDRLSDHCDNHC